MEYIAIVETLPPRHSLRLPIQKQFDFIGTSTVTDFQFALDRKKSRCYRHSDFALLKFSANYSI